MRKGFIYSSITLLIIATGIFTASFTGIKSALEPGRDRLFNSDWKFIRDSLQGAERPGYDDSGWMTVDLPHDLSLIHI
jgi:hypothetical protein